MNERLPVEIENLELPSDGLKIKKEINVNKSYGYVSILYVLSMIITIGTVLITVFLGNR